MFGNDSKSTQQTSKSANLSSNSSSSDHALQNATSATQQRHRFASTLNELTTQTASTRAKEQQQEVSAANSNNDSSQKQQQKPLLLLPVPSSSSSSSSYSSSPSQRPATQVFRGLSNQGATCYMNSLLQTLFMTPEFRKGLYQWDWEQYRSQMADEHDREAQEDRSHSQTTAKTTQDYSYLLDADLDDQEDDDDESPDDCIPYQLQKLFGKLQLSTSKTSISTKALTKSFGWTGADVFQQHDVQELCRVLFDALEKSFKETVNETLVNDLYQGALKDFVQCLKCGYESSRVDHFLDLSLVIRPFGSDRLMRSVEEAMELFLKPEILNKENQWMCDRCKVKRDAIKGLKFSKLPYLLSLQLKRFDFDYRTMNRIKLHDQVTFPQYLDMNSYMSSTEGTAKRSGKIARKMSMERHELEHLAEKRKSSNASDMATSEFKEPTTAVASDNIATAASSDDHFTKVDEDAPLDDKEEKETFDTWSADFDVDAMIKRSGPHVYELFSVLVHSGSALGGHYYAFIRSFENGKWYNFNDSSVSEISEKEVQTAWGVASGSSTGYASRVSYSTCAYMLMYRQVSKKHNIMSIPNEMIPMYLRQTVEEEEEKWRQMERERIEMERKVLLKFYIRTSSKGLIEKPLYVYKTNTFAQALYLACEAFEKEFQVVFPSNKQTNVRLRHFSEYYGTMSDVVDTEDDSLKTLQEWNVYAGQQFFVETKQKDTEPWPAYEATTLQVFVQPFIDPRLFHEELDATSKSLINDEEGDDEERQELIELRDQQNAMSETQKKALRKRWMSSSNVRCLQLPNEATVESLCQLIRSKWDISLPGQSSGPQKIRLLYRKSSSFAIGSESPIVVLNKSDEASALKLRDDLSMSNGADLYFEVCENLECKSHAVQKFEREANLIELTFKYEKHSSGGANGNNISSSTSSAPHVVTEKLRIDRRKTVRSMKQRISKRIALPMDKFKILRGPTAAGVEIKAIDSTLAKLSLSNNSTVFIVEGTPLNVGEYNFRITLYRPMGIAKLPSLADAKPDQSAQELDDTSPEPQEDAGSLDGSVDDPDCVVLCAEKAPNELVFVGNAIISEEMPVEQIRQRVFDLLCEKHFLPDDANHGGFTPSHLRLRDQHQNILTQILVDGNKLCDVSGIAAYEGRTVNVQIMGSTDEFHQLETVHRVVELVLLDRSDWRFHRRHSMNPVLINNSVKEVADILAEKASAMFNVPRYELAFARVLLGERRDQVDIFDAMKVCFCPIDDLIEAFQSDSAPYMELWLVIDKRVRPAPVTALEKPKLQQLIQTQSNLIKQTAEKKKAAAQAQMNQGMTYHSMPSYSKPRESALVIRTKSKGSAHSSAKDGSEKHHAASRSVGATSSNDSKPHGLPRSGTPKHVGASSSTEEDDDLVHQDQDALFGDLA